MGLLAIISCSKSTSSPEFVKKATGRYLYNADELMEVYFEDEQLFMKWRGAERIKPLRIDETTFFVKEMNKKVQFREKPNDPNMYLGVVHKDKKDSLTYDFRKLDKGEKIPSEYIENKEFDKALTAYLKIRERDSLNPSINERSFNSLGYRALRAENYESAIGIFKMNVELYPESNNVYDSLAEAYLKSGDTLQALSNYKLALERDSGNGRIKRTIKELENKEQEP